MSLSSCSVRTIDSEYMSRIKKQNKNEVLSFSLSILTLTLLKWALSRNSKTLFSGISRILEKLFFNFSGLDYSS
jgi:hypothetical protein